MSFERKINHYINLGHNTLHSSRQPNDPPQFRGYLHPWIWTASVTTADKPLEGSPPLLLPPLPGRDGSKACPPVRQMLRRAVSCRTRDPRALSPSRLQPLCPPSVGRVAKCRTAGRRWGQRREAEPENAARHHNRSRPRRANDVSKERGWTQSGTRPGDWPTFLSRRGYRPAFALMWYRPAHCTKHISEKG